MNRLFYLGIYVMVMLFSISIACTPKTTEETTKTPTTAAPTPKENPCDDPKLSSCTKFCDVDNTDEVETNYVLYRDFLKLKDYDQAFPMWEKVYTTAPAADGRRNTVYADGIRFYEHFIRQTQDAAQKEAYIDRIFEIYDEIDNCYPEGGYIAGRKAFDYFYKYPERSTKEETFALFKQSMDTDGMKAQDFILNPMASLLVDLYREEKVSVEEAKTYQQKIRDVLANGLEKCQGKSCERWKIIEEYAPVRLEAFETVKGFYDCEYYSNKYYPEYLESPDDCDNLRTVYSRLKWGGCDENSPQLAEIVKVGNEKCVEKTERRTGPIAQGNDCLQNADYQCAIDNYQAAADAATDPTKKGKYLLTIAKIYNSHLKNFPKARQFAEKAAEARPNWGDPYIFIGRLYASSGPLCGSGRGWNSQVVVWPAIDMWAKAKKIDANVAAEANKWIGRYSQYMPNMEDIFQRNLKEGDTFRVPCWIQRNTVIRAAR